MNNDTCSDNNTNHNNHNNQNNDNHNNHKALTHTEKELMCVIRVQAIARKWIARHHFLLVRKFIIKIQAIVRAWLAAKRLLDSGKVHKI